MPRRRRQKNGESPPPRLLPEPCGLLEPLVKLLSSRDASSRAQDSGGTAERPSKRLKQAHDAGNFEAIPITIVDITLPSRNETALPPGTEASWSNADDIVELSLVSHPGQQPGPDLSEVVLTHRLSRPKVRVSFVAESQAFTNTEKDLLECISKKSQDSGLPGCVWAALDRVRIRQAGDDATVVLSVRVHWNTGGSALKTAKADEQSHRKRMLLAAWQSDRLSAPFATSVENSPARLPQEFYEAACIPDREAVDQETASMVVPGLTAKLYPFQRRAVQWLLQREGVHWSEGEGEGEGAGQADAAVRLYVSPQASDPPLTFEKAADLHGDALYVSPLCGVVARDMPEIRGGILAEEMGLGKTLEIASLILLHRQPTQDQGPNQALDLHTGQLLPACPATLIVAPSALLQQWLSELKRHAPGLAVLHYDGVKRAKKQRGEGGIITASNPFLQQDVVITTYDVLKKEIWAARAALRPSDRCMRGKRKHELPPSPLIGVMWWRVCIDEAQTVENVSSHAAEMAKIIPRVNAWCVTGTPVQNDVTTDLHGLLVFLHAEPYAENMHAWEQVVKAKWPGRRDPFFQLFNQLAMRHTKSLVRDEIDVPAQRRYVISIPFTAIEEQHYRDLFSILASECGLDDCGQPIGEDQWNADDPKVKEAMRRALDRLRQTALHPEVGLLNRQHLRGQGQKTAGRAPLRTLVEVLDAMIDQNEIAMRTDQRLYFQTELKRGQLLARLGQTEQAIELWKETSKSIDDIVQPCREQLAREMEEARKEDDNEGAKSPRDEPDDSGPSRVGEARRRLRSMLEIQHIAVLFRADGYFALKSFLTENNPHSPDIQLLEQKEVEAYNRAKAIRKEIVHDAHVKVKVQMDSLAATARQQAFAVIPNTKTVPQGGIESNRIALAMQDMFDTLDSQADQLDEWREAVVQSLIKPLVDDEGEEVTGEEYDESTRLQDDVMAFLTVLRATIADRQATMTGQQSGLAEHEAKTAMELAGRAEGPSPEKMLELFGARERVRCEFWQDDPLTSLRGIMSELRSLSTKLRGDEKARASSRAAAEKQIMLGLVELAHATLSEQGSAIVALNKETERFKDILNARIDFYRQLQAISDAVTPPDGEVSEREVTAAKADAHALQEKITTHKDKHRYLMHLKEVETNGSEESRMCIICQCPFEIGVLTPCGHKFCKECLAMWAKAFQYCPMCKRKITRSSLQDISLKPQELKVHSDNISAASSASSPADGSAAGTPSSSSATSATSPPARPAQIYADFQQDKLAEIKNMDLLGPSFTTKVDTMVRHLLWLRRTDHGAKSIVFSQYREFLAVLAQAFRQHGIGYASFDGTTTRAARRRDGSNGNNNINLTQGVGAHFAHPPAARRAHDSVQSFKEDPDVEVLLLSARAGASGLNLVNASHVFLCEPLVNTALELQAIARVDRIGQRQETTVWLYIVRGTVEESIYKLSVQRRLQHLTSCRRRSSRDSAEGAGEGNEITDVGDAPGGGSSYNNDAAAGTDAEEENVAEQEEPDKAGEAKDDDDGDNDNDDGLGPGGLDAANSMELQQARLSRLMGTGNSGEVVADTDLWACLFGHVAN